MIICLGILLFVIGCCMSSSAEDSYRIERNNERRHKELMKAIPSSSSVRKSKVTRRRILKDPDGNVIAEEIIEEVE